MSQLICDFLNFFFLQKNLLCVTSDVTCDIVSVMWQRKFHCFDFNLVLVYVCLVQFNPYLCLSYSI